MNIVKLTPFLNRRSRTNKPELIILHATAGSTARSSINHLRTTGSSYHYIITRDAKDTAKSENAENTEPIIHQCVADASEAIHVSSRIPSPGGLPLNRSSIGISLANIQRKTNPEAYPAKQLAALNELLAHLKATIPSLKFLTAHAVIQPWNRADPSNLKWEKLAEKHGFTFFKPTAEQIAKHKPKKK